MTTSDLWTTVKDELRERRERKQYAHRLRQDLAAYRTPAEVEDLLAIIDRRESEGEDGTDTRLVRSILTDNLRDYYATRQPGRHVVGL